VDLQQFSKVGVLFEYLSNEQLHLLRVVGLVLQLQTSAPFLGGKWKPIIIYKLDKSSHRFGRLDLLIPGISRKVLTKQLSELTEDGIVVRTAYPESPPRVEYHLTKKGKELIPILKQLSNWGSYLIEKNKK